MTEPVESRPIPKDFLDQRALLRDVKKLSAHYKVARRTVSRWVAELGLPDLRKDEAHRANGRASARKALSSRPRYASVKRLNNYSVHDEAAEVLRAYLPVYRCDERGRGDYKGKFWRIGFAVCDGDELLARAERYRRVEA